MHDHRFEFAVATRYETRGDFPQFCADSRSRKSPLQNGSRSYAKQGNSLLIIATWQPVRESLLYARACNNKRETREIAGQESSRVSSIAGEFIRQ